MIAALMPAESPLLPVEELRNIDKNAIVIPNIYKLKIALSIFH